MCDEVNKVLKRRAGRGGKAPVSGEGKEWDQIKHPYSSLGQFWYFIVYAIFICLFDSTKTLKVFLLLWWISWLGTPDQYSVFKKIRGFTTLSWNSQPHISRLPLDVCCRRTLTNVCIVAHTDVRTCAAALINTKQMASPHFDFATKPSKQPLKTPATAPRKAKVGFPRSVGIPRPPSTPLFVSLSFPFNLRTPWAQSSKWLKLIKYCCWRPLSKSK